MSTEDGARKTSLEDSVRKWLDTQGYPLEMRVAEVMRDLEIGWDHGRVYNDPVTKKVREIDLIGYLDYRDPKFNIHPVFECKHSQGRPWVMFCTDRPMLTASAHVTSLPGTRLAKEAMSSVRDMDRVQRMRLFRRPDLVGFNIVRAHNDNQDAAFHAVHGLGAACLETAQHLGQWKHRIIFPPIIVVDSPLLQCYLPAGAKDYVLREAQEGVLLSNPGGDTGRIVMFVVHISALHQFVGEMKVDSKDLYEIIRPSLERDDG